MSDLLGMRHQLGSVTGVTDGDMVEAAWKLACAASRTHTDDVEATTDLSLVMSMCGLLPGQGLT